jgi:uncharacterized membrane-anchored protein YjiN (DUF445 family)
MKDKEIETKQLEKEIQEAIARNLPKQVGDVLALRLEKLSSLEEESVNLKKIIEQKIIELKEVRDEKDKLADSLSKHEDLTYREKEVEDRERNLKIYELEVRLQSAKDIQAAYDKFLASLTKNQIVRETISKSLNSGVDYTNGGNVRYPTGEYISTTKEVE